MFGSHMFFPTTYSIVLLVRTIRVGQAGSVMYSAQVRATAVQIPDVRRRATGGMRANVQAGSL